MKKGIIFDMDGTLWDSAENVAKSWTEKIHEAGYLDKSVSEADIKSIMGKTMDVIADQLFPYTQKGEERDKLRKLCEVYEIEYIRAHGGKLYPNVIETLQELKNLGYHIYIVSNCQAGYIEAFLHFFQLDIKQENPLIEDIECYGNNFLSKGKNILLIAKRNKLDKAVYVGDIQSDYDSTCEAGFPFIHAAYGFGKINEKVPEVKTFSELLDVVPTVI